MRPESVESRMVIAMPNLTHGKKTKNEKRFRSREEFMVLESEKRLRSEQKDAELRLDATCKRIDDKVDDLRTETGDKIDGLRTEMNQRFDALTKEFNTSRKWSIGLLIMMALGFAATIGVFVNTVASLLYIVH